MYDDVADFIRSCELCQKQGDIKISTKTELHSVPIPGNVMKQVSVDLCNLPEVDGFHHLFVCIDYFSKWSEARPLKNKSATVIAQALYELMCRHGCFAINDQGREFVNGISTELYKLTGVEQRITSAYHPPIQRSRRMAKQNYQKQLSQSVKRQSVRMAIFDRKEYYLLTELANIFLQGIPISNCFTTGILYFLST